MRDATARVAAVDDNESIATLHDTDNYSVAVAMVMEPVRELSKETVAKRVEVDSIRHQADHLIGQLEAIDSISWCNDESLSRPLRGDVAAGKDDGTSALRGSVADIHAK